MINVDSLLESIEKTDWETVKVNVKTSRSNEVYHCRVTKEDMRDFLKEFVAVLSGERSKKYGLGFIEG